MTATYVPSQLRDLPGLGLSLVSVRDYGAVGSGLVDDLTAIRAAIAAVSALGAGIVWFPRGTYRVSAAVVCASNVVLMGEGPQSVIKLADGANTHTVSIPDGTAGAPLRYIKVDGNRANQTDDAVNGVEIVSSSDVELDHVTVLDARGIGVNATLNGTQTHNDGIRVTHSTISGSGNSCVRMRGADNVELDHNTFTNWGTVTAATPAVCPNYDIVSSQWNIHHNTFRNAVGTLFAIEVSATTGLLDSEVSHNLFDANSLEGGGISGYYHRCVFSHNRHISGVNTHRTGYEIVGDDNVIEGNNVSLGSIVVAETGGVTSARCVVRGNHVANAGSGVSAIAMIGTDHLVSGNHITLSHPSVTQIGIVLGRFGTSQVLTRCLVEGNHIRSTVANAHQGVALWGASGSGHVFITGNYCSGLYAPYWDEADNNWDEVTVTGNDFHGNYTGPGHNALSGTFRIYNNVLAADQAGVYSPVPAVSGDRSDGVALTNLLTALAAMGLITDSTTA